MGKKNKKNVVEETVVKTKKQLYDERKAKRDAERAKQQAILNKKAMKAELKKKYRNPVYSVGGQIVIWFLAVAMIAAMVIAIVFLIIENF